MNELNDDSLSVIFGVLYPLSMLQFRLVCKRWYAVSNPETFRDTYITIYPCFKSVGIANRYEDLLVLMLKYEVYDSELLEHYMHSYHFAETEYLHKLPETLLLIMLCGNTELLAQYIVNRYDMEPVCNGGYIAISQELWSDRVIDIAMSSNTKEMALAMTNHLDRGNRRLTTVIKSATRYDRHDILHLMRVDNLKGALCSNMYVTANIIVIAKNSTEFIQTLSSHSGIDFSSCMVMSNAEIYLSVKGILSL